MTAPTRPEATEDIASPAAVRFVALGDSLTEGVGSPCAEGWRGWSALLAPTLAPDPTQVAHRNLAVSGALATDLTITQLPDALDLNPQFAAVLIGGNDTLRAGFDIARTAAALDATLRALADQGAVLLTACLPDPAVLLGLPAALARPLARRMGAVNAVVHELSDRHRAIHLHLAQAPWLHERALLSADRLHPSPAGHLLIARQFHALLAESGHRLGPPPAAVQAPPPPSRAADLWWLATRGTAWLARRSVDLLPGLLALAAVESVHRLRGTASALDVRSRAAAEAVLAALPPP
ncbi:SGNH/GDSL hydrolase family protein [Kitasatospora kifunensis]|uniref:Lysophospholipase L1-like esterase n=1 Tax=Kitasatospora kifunensis TaxID=58351 RepID=A0A7W7VUP6_KITKI|nr:SGNH/GDSL hydrolase family protein [Kitasatospora kifunensis]MBB4923053.1 lysophospholipase L1-like esterase [Kitasatospora kifunensis]